jgi:alkyl hydroperoxide reductase subunit AhpF
VIPKPDQVAIAQHLIEHLAGRVGIDVWTRPESAIVLPDRDNCEHCDDVLTVARELVSLSSLLSVTRYDLDRHAERAATEGIERAPTTVLRAQGARLHFVGYFSGLLFPVFVDSLILVGAGVAPLQAESKLALAAVTMPVHLEVLVAPYDPLSAYMVRIASALAVEQHAIRFTATEMSEFPILAAQRSVTEVPTIVINGRRFTGLFSEAELVEQVRRIVEGNTEPVIRERTAASPYFTAEQARAMATAGVDSPPAAPPQPSGLFIPGR